MIKAYLLGWLAEQGNSDGLDCEARCEYDKIIRSTKTVGLKGRRVYEELRMVGRAVECDGLENR